LPVTAWVSRSRWSPSRISRSGGTEPPSAASPLGDADDAELEEGGALDQLAHPVGVVDAGELHDDAVAARRLDHRLGDAVGVDAVVDRLLRLVDGGGAHLGGGLVAHREDQVLILPLDLPARQVLGDQLAGGVTRLRRRGGDGELPVAGAAPLQAGGALVLAEIEQPRHVGVGLGPQGVLGVDLQHEVHAPLQVEAEIDLFFRRIGQGNADHRHREDQQPAPEQITIHD
jgi:hypothetical protein